MPAAPVTGRLSLRREAQPDQEHRDAGKPQDDRHDDAQAQLQLGQPASRSESSTPKHEADQAADRQQPVARDLDLEREQQQSEQRSGAAPA